MNKFVQTATNVANMTCTENGANALTTTGSALLDLFAVSGALREKSEEEITKMFHDAFAEDKLLATKLMFYCRNVRGGQGERRTFRAMLKYMAMANPEIVIKNMELIPLFGRYDDLYSLIGTPTEDDMWKFIDETLAKDIIALKAGKSVSLCAKWMKSINTSSEESNALGKKTAKQLGMRERTYRKMLSSLRKYIQVTEKTMSTGNWDEISYEKVPSYAMKNYRKAFGRHDPTGFSKYIESVTKGEAKINSTTLFPYDIFVSGKLEIKPRAGRYVFSLNDDKVLEAQWKALPNYVKEGSNVLVMADTSGSMMGLPISIALSLAVYFAERNKGPFKDLMMTFSSMPSFVQLKGNTLNDKLAQIPAIVQNTNIEAAFQLVLRTAVAGKVSAEDMPKAIVVISDMQFDESTSGNQFGKTLHDQIKENFEELGYKMPEIIYWQVSARQTALQASKDGNGVMLVSGASASTFKSVIENIGKTPYEAMLQVLNSKIYDCVRV